MKLHRLPRPETYRKDPSKPSLTLDDLKERRMREAERWVNITTQLPELIRSVWINQDTMLLAGWPLDWEAFEQTEYWAKVRRELDGRLCRRYRAWWKLMQVCRRACGSEAAPVANERMKNALAFAHACLYAEGVRRASGRAGLVDGGRFGLAEDHAMAIREAVAGMYDELMLES